ncbi:MAG: hypothetical protein NVS2B7_36160 [Herpetosiphon sp.]
MSFALLTAPALQWWKHAELKNHVLYIGATVQEIVVSILTGRSRLFIRKRFAMLRGVFMQLWLRVLGTVCSAVLFTACGFGAVSGPSPVIVGKWKQTNDVFMYEFKANGTVVATRSDALSQAAEGTYGIVDEKRLTVNVTGLLFRPRSGDIRLQGDTMTLTEGADQSTFTRMK